MRNKYPSPLIADLLLRVTHPPEEEPKLLTYRTMGVDETALAASVVQTYQETTISLLALHKNTALSSGSFGRRTSRPARSRWLQRNKRWPTQSIPRSTACTTRSIG